MLHCFEDSIGVVRTSAFLTIRCGVASCQRRDDWSRVKDRLNQSCVRGIFVPYLLPSCCVYTQGFDLGCDNLTTGGERQLDAAASCNTSEVDVIGD